MLYVLLCGTTLIELTVQFSDLVFSGEEKSGSIIVIVDLIGGTASHDFSVSVTMSPVTATGKLYISKNMQMCIKHHASK